MDQNLTNSLAALGSILSAVVAIMALAATHFQNQVKKYEIKRDYQEDIVTWFSKTTELLIKLRLLLVNNPKEFEINKFNLLASLSAQIEIGRLYFPNIYSGDGYGSDKPKAYQGYRNIILVFLVYSFDILLLDDAIKYEKHLLRLQREYTSAICDIVDPNSFLEETHKHSDKFFSPKISVIEFIAENPETLDLFVKKRKSTQE